MINQLVRRAMVGVCASVMATSALALDVPTHSRSDHRVRYASYNPGDVIQLDAVIGVATVIELEKDEQYEFHVFGDADAYDFTHYANHLFFKPIAEDADSNLIVVTNKRNYTFRVRYSGDRSTQALYKLVLRYPDTQARQKREKAQKAHVDAAFSTPDGPVNWRSYAKSGDMVLAPQHAWDDGKKTWLQFGANSEIPAVYRVTPDGQEVLTNYHMADHRTMVLHRISSRWHLRLGEQVVAIHNANIGSGHREHTGTSSLRVERVVKGSDTPSAEPVKDQSANLAEKDALSPTKMWQEDGYTVMHFDSGRLPSVQALDDSGKPHELPVTIQDSQTIKVGGTSKNWLLRRDGKSQTFSTGESEL